MKTNTTDAFDFTIPHIISVQPRQNWSLHDHEAVLTDLPLLRIDIQNHKDFITICTIGHPFDSFEWLHKQGFNAPLNWKRFSV